MAVLTAEPTTRPRSASLEERSAVPRAPEKDEKKVNESEKNEASEAPVPNKRPVFAMAGNGEAQPEPLNGNATSPPMQSGGSAPTSVEGIEEEPEKESKPEGDAGEKKIKGATDGSDGTAGGDEGQGTPPAGGGEGAVGNDKPKSAVKRELGKASVKSGEVKGEETESEAPKVEGTIAEQQGKNVPVSTVNLVTDSSSSVAESLVAQKPTGFILGLKQADAAFKTAQEVEKTNLEDSLPEIQKPTGIPVKSDKERQEGKKPAARTAESLKAEKSLTPEMEVKGKKEGKHVPEESPQPQSIWEQMKNFFGFGAGTEEDKKSEVQKNIRKLPTSENVDADPGEKPTVDLSGQANPGQNEQHLSESESSVGKDQQKNLQESNLYHGENDINPSAEPETLKPNVSLVPPPDLSSLDEELPPVSQEVKDKFDLEAQAHMDEQTAPEMKKKDAELEKMQAEQEKERAKTDSKIDEETQNVKAEQEAAQKQAQSEVASHRKSWQEENEAVKKEFADTSAAEKTKVDSNIDAKVKETDSKVSKEYDKAQKNADQEVAKTETEADKRKKEAEKKSKERSWWDRAIDAIGSFFDKLKEGLNIIFDGLRKLVKGIIEVVKKLANKLIDLARDAIVGMIKVFGEVLKGIVNVALAAFPKLRDKFNAFIDQAVDFAVKAVNMLAEGLKKAVNALLDALGAVLDFILSVYQAFYNLLLDALKFIVVGMLKILRGLANLVLSAIEMPGQFMGQLSEEFLGMNVYEPLPFERSTKTAPATADSSSGGASNSELADLLAKKSYGEDDFSIDPPINDFYLPPELLTEIPASGEKEFGENNQNTMEAFKASLMSEAVNGEAGADTGQEVSGQLPEGMPEIPEDPYEQVDWFIDYQNKQGEGANQDVPDSPEGKSAATNESFPEEMKLIGPLNPGARLYYLKEQMIAGIKKKWEQNKVKYIAIGAVVVLGITALLIATGGAILSVLPPAFQIFAAIMLGAAAIKAMSFFGKYLKEGFLGKLIEGAKGLARAIGIILVELLFILLFDSAALFKVLKTAAKSGVKGVVNLAKTATKSTFKALGKGLKATGKGFVKQAGKAKFFVKNVGKRIAKGAKSFDDFGKRLAKRFKFKGFKIKLEGFRFKLFGKVNPWVLLASGKVDNVELDKITDAGGGKGVGSLVKVGGEDAFVVGVKGTAKESAKSSFVKGLLKGTDEAGELTEESIKRNASVFKGLVKASQKGKNAKESAEFVAMAIKGRSGVPRNPHFRKNFFDMVESYGLRLSENAKKFLSIHHVVPNALKGVKEIDDLLKSIGHNIDEVANAIALPRIDLNKLDEIIKLLDDGLAAGKNLDEMAEVKRFLDEIQEGLKLGDDVMDPAELRRILKELEDMKDATTHAFDSYHPKFNAQVKETMTQFTDTYKDLIKQGFSKSDALKAMKPKIDDYISNVFDDLLSGNPKILE